MFVYKIVNSLNDNVYIGITSKDLETRYKWHIRDCRRGDRKKLYIAMRELGEDNFRIELVEECQDKELIKTREEFYIKFFDCYTSGYNASPKSGGVKEHTSVTREKMAIAAANRKASQETKLKMSQSMKGYWRALPDERKLELAIKCKGRNQDKKHTEEFSKMCSERMLGHKHSEETKLKMSNTRKDNFWAKDKEVTCPYCNKSGKGGAMIQWHFDNCRYKL